MNRPKPVQYLCCSHRRQCQTAQWTDLQWRQYRAAYRHFTRDVDSRIGRVLAALQRRPDATDTLIVFFSDHGDGVGAHRLSTKHTTFYEETTRVPLVFAGQGVGERGLAVGPPLVSLLDLVPTLCDVARTPIPEGLPGCSLRPAFFGNSTGHDGVVSQWHTEWGSTLEPGRMLRTERFKYTIYREDTAEELFDLEADPGEKINLAQNPDYAVALEEHRERFRAYCAEWDDPFETLEFRADPRWRSHPVGYHCHEGPCAADGFFDERKV